MYVEIHSRSEVDEDSRGLPLWMNIEPSTVAVVRSRPEHLGGPPWHIEITAEQYIEQSSGKRSEGLKYRAAKRTLQLQLTPSDLSRLLDVALSNGLLQVSAKA